MDMTTQDIAASVGGAWDALSALAVAYAFSVMGAIILLVAGFLVAGFAERWSYAGLKRVRGFDETLSRFFSKILRYVILVMVGITVLAQFGVQTASVLAALGAAGLAIGLALQGTLQNIAAGIMLLVLKPFRAGEYITTANVSGTVVEIGLFATELRGPDGIFLLSPNSELWKAPVTNYTRNQQRRNDLTIGIGYDDDIELAQSILAGLAQEDARVLADPEPATFVAELGDSAVSVTLRYWTSTSNWWQTKLDLTKAAKLAFDGHGISIPYPQQEVRYVRADTDQSAPPRLDGPATARDIQPEPERR